MPSVLPLFMIVAFCSEAAWARGEAGSAWARRSSMPLDEDADQGGLPWPVAGLFGGIFACSDLGVVEAILEVSTRFGESG